MTDKRAIELGIEALKEIQKKRGMTIDKAIGILRQTYTPSSDPVLMDYNDALKLGIEALKKWKEYRASDQSWWGNLLPGETEE